MKSLNSTCSVSRLAAAFAMCVAATGCEALSPQQLWKLNRQPNMERGDAYFSVPAEMPGDAEPGDVISDLDAPAARTSQADSS